MDGAFNGSPKITCVSPCNSTPNMEIVFNNSPRPFYSILKTKSCACSTQWFQIPKTCQKQISRVFSASCSKFTCFPFPVNAFTSYPKIVSNCCNYSYDRSISRTFQSNFWQVCAIRPNCAAGPRWAHAVSLYTTYILSGPILNGELRSNGPLE